jgi:hypothetical protein
MHEVKLNEPVMVRLGKLVFVATWRNGYWQIGRNLKLKTQPYCWTAIIGDGQR